MSLTAFITSWCLECAEHLVLIYQGLEFIAFKNQWLHFAVISIELFPVFATASQRSPRATQRQRCVETCSTNPATCWSAARSAVPLQPAIYLTLSALRQDESQGEVCYPLSLPHRTATQDAYIFTYSGEEAFWLQDANSLNKKHSKRRYRMQVTTCINHCQIAPLIHFKKAVRA